MGSNSRRVGIFEGPDNDLEMKPLNAKGRRRSTKGKQITPLKRTMAKMHCNTRSRGIGEQTQSGQKLLCGREQRKSVLENGKLNGGKCDKLRRSARLEARRSRNVMST